MSNAITTAEVRTRHPEHYLLHNVADGTTWSLTEDGHWVRANQPTEPARVLPSREEVRALFHQDHMDPCTGWCETQTERVLALFANAPTVEQVKAEAAVERVRALADEWSTTSYWAAATCVREALDGE